MQIDNILIVSPPGYGHHLAFFDIAMSFKQSFPNDPILTIDSNLCEDGTTLVFGAHLLARFDAKIDGDYVIYQTEQLAANDSLFVDEKYIDLLRRFPVWDYCQSNVDFLESKGICAKHVPIGYSKSLGNIKTGKSASLMGGGRNGPQRIDFSEWSGVYPITSPTGGFVEDIDVMFAGSINERRQKIIEELKGKEIDGRPLVVASFIGYGGFRDKLIARSKIVLNCHFYDSAIHEIFRTSHLFSNKKAVVSEYGKDAGLEAQFYGGGGFVEYDGLVDRCLDLLKDDAARHTVAEHGYNIFKKTTQAEILRGIQ